MARGVSTVLDVTVCLLLISAAVATLAAVSPADGGDQSPSADATAARLATVTAAVPTADGRLQHDTLAGHLATAAVENTAQPTAEYQRNTRNETVAHVDNRTFVTVVWEPFRNASVSSRFTLGAEPPEHVDVAVTTLTVDMGVRPPERRSSFTALADALAGAYVDRLFPPERTRAALVDSRAAPWAISRYRTATTKLGLGIDVADPITAANARRANRILASA
ncbi:MAG: hypothetical protein ACI80F_000289, partial [Natronomonas sp.]